MAPSPTHVPTHVHVAQPLHEYLRRNARERPTGVAYFWYGRAISWAELDQASDAFAARLQALGVQAGEPVVLFMNNCPQYVIAHYGVQKIGAIVCPCSPLNKAHELLYQLDDLQARTIVCADTLLALLEQVRARSAIQHVFVVRYAALLPAQPSIAPPAELLAMQAQPPAALPLGGENFEALLGRAAQPQPVALSLDGAALMTYTSGTTGLPKGALLSYRNALFKTAAAAQCNNASADDVLLAVAPLYHIAGMLMGINLPVYTGASTVLLYRFEPQAAAAALAQYRVSWWYSITPMNLALLRLPGIQALDLSALRMNPVTSFGVLFTPELAQQWQALAVNCCAFEAAYGLSETHTVDTCMPPAAIRWGTQGVAVPGNEIRIIDPDTGAPLPPGVRGEITVRGPGNFLGYWRQPEATARTLRNGWVHTGDIGSLDADGYLSFVGRIKEMVKVSGYSVFPEEVEAIFLKHPAVAQVAVIGVPDPHKGEVVRAFIVAQPGQPHDAEALLDWARDNMAAYKVPRELRFIDALPTTGAGKVLRRLLQDVA